MARIRWAEKCQARSSKTGRACRAWTVRGAVVCVAHGGASPQVRGEADIRMVRQVFERGFADVWARYQKALLDFRVQQVLTAAELLNMEIEDVRPEHVIWCRAQHGRPASIEDGPKLSDLNMDGRLVRAVVRSDV